LKSTPLHPKFTCFLFFGVLGVSFFFFFLVEQPQQTMTANVNKLYADGFRWIERANQEYKRNDLQACLVYYMEGIENFLLAAKSHPLLSPILFFFFPPLKLTPHLLSSSFWRTVEPDEAKKSLVTAQIADYLTFVETLKRQITKDENAIQRSAGPR
jgi:hypothetical protein